MIGPTIRHQLGKNQNVVYVNLKGSNSWKYNFLVGFFMDECIFLVFQLGRFTKLVGNRVFDYNGITNEPFDLSLY